jgi:tetratricopeptide (TPR) repeat protein
MDCPRCGGRSAKSHNLEAVCEYCGINMPLYAKAKVLSNAHYDRGLKLAKAYNLTAAIEELSAALQINKKNIQARNLLGLVFYAMGRIGEALREWVISANYGADENLAKEYLIVFQNDMALLEKYSDALHNYNEALQFMGDYSEDLAAIRLKRAIEINPDFVDALNMLALVCLKTGDRHRAGALAEHVLSIDAGNPFAKRYYREIFLKKAPSGRKLKAHMDEASLNYEKAQDKAALQKGDRQNPFYAQSQRPVAKTSPISGLLLFAAGLGAMFLFMYILVLPSFLEDSLAESAALSAEIDTRQAAHATQISELEEAIAGLEAELGQYMQTAALQDEQNRNLQNEVWVNNAYSYLSRELPHAALNALENVEVGRLSADALSTYHHVVQTATPIVEQSYHQLGQIQFNNGEYAQARESLESAARLITEESVVAHYVLYLLGRIAEVQEDYSLARSYYERIINDFPGTNRVNAANIRLNQLPA